MPSFSALSNFYLLLFIFIFLEYQNTQKSKIKDIKIQQKYYALRNLQKTEMSLHHVPSASDT